MPLSNSSPTSPYGQIIVEPFATSRYRDREVPGPATQVVRWVPPVALKSRLPTGFGPELLAWEDQYGNSCFAPPAGAKTLVYQCQLCGLEVIRCRRNLSPQQVFSYRVHHLVFSWLQARGARFRRSFSSTSDLMIKRRGRVDDAVHVLPLHLGRTADDCGGPWSVTQLMQVGILAARDEGIERPRPVEAIAYGLMAAAERNPLYVRDHEAASLMRMALYAPSDGPVPSPEVRDEVEARLCMAIEEHLDDSIDRFNNWFKGAHSNLVKSLANRKTGCGKLSQETVKRVLFDLGWEAYTAVSNCVHASMRWMGKCLADQLTPQSLTLFEQLYEPQPAFGDLPLLLMDRGAIIQPAILRLLGAPHHRRQIAVFHRVLEYYKQMVTKRRQVDVQAKAAACRVVTQPRLTVARKAIEALARTKLDLSTKCCEHFGSRLELQANDRRGVRPAFLVYALCPLHPGNRQTIELARPDVVAALSRNGNRDLGASPLTNRQQMPLKPK